MKYHILSLGLPDELFDYFKRRFYEIQAELVMALNLRDAARLFSAHRFHLVIVDMECRKGADQEELLAGLRGDGSLPGRRLLIDPPRRRVEVQGRPVELRPREFNLLLYLMRNPGIVLTAEQICEHAWGMEGGYNQGVSHPIRLLRPAIEPDPKHPIYIETVPRVGYRFTAHRGEICELC